MMSYFSPVVLPLTDDNIFIVDPLESSRHSYVHYYLVWNFDCLQFILSNLKCVYHG